jgi:hypothetical protein
LDIGPYIGANTNASIFLHRSLDIGVDIGASIFLDKSLHIRTDTNIGITFLDKSLAMGTDTTTGIFLDKSLDMGADTNASIFLDRGLDMAAYIGTDTNASIFLDRGSDMAVDIGVDIFPGMNTIYTHIPSSLSASIYACVSGSIPGIISVLLQGVWHSCSYLGRIKILSSSFFADISASMTAFCCSAFSN